jgi:hypothetical protein
VEQARSHAELRNELIAPAFLQAVPDRNACSERSGLVGTLQRQAILPEDRMMDMPFDFLDTQQSAVWP